MNKIATPRLAIVASSFDKPSETFIRTHVDNLLPGRTVTIDWPAHGSTNPPISNGAIATLRLSPPPRGLIGYFKPPFNADDTERARAFLRSQNVGAVLAEFGPAAVQISKITRKTGTPLFPHFHGVDVSKRMRNPLAVGQYRRLFPVAKAIIAPSRFLIEKLVAAGCPADKTHVIPCGVDADRFSPSARMPGRALMVGRLVDKKGPLTSIQAFARAAELFPDARLDVVGDGPLLQACQQVVATTSMSGQISLHGALPHTEVSRLMSQASIFLQHSVTPRDGNTEGMPVALLEAMASGLGIVTTRHAGIPEAITNEIEGLLVDERDSAGMSAAITRLLESPAAIEDLGDAARQRFLSDFKQEVTNGKLRAVIGL